MRRRGYHPEPAHLALDEWTAERLLSGGLAPDDAPPAYQGVARLLAAAAAPPTPAELAGEDEARAAYGSRLAGPALAGGRTARRLVPLAVAATVFALGTGIAAATGNLPDPAQDAVAAALGHVGVSVPDGDDDDPAADEPAESPDDERPGRGDGPPPGQIDNPGQGQGPPPNPGLDTGPPPGQVDNPGQGQGPPPNPGLDTGPPPGQVGNPGQGQDNARP